MPIAFHPPLEHAIEPPPAVRGNDDPANADLFAALLSGAAAAADTADAPRATGEHRGPAHDDDSPASAFDAMAAFAAAAGLSLGLVAGHAGATPPPASAPAPAEDGDAKGATARVAAARAAQPDIATGVDARATPQAPAPPLAADPGPRVPHAANGRPPANARVAMKAAPADAVDAGQPHEARAAVKDAAASPAPLVQAAALLARAGDAGKALATGNAPKATDDAPGVAANAAAAAPAAAPPAVRTIAEAVGTPGFVPAVAQELAQLVRVNAQRAELHLHPAEMGPIDVRLHMHDNQVSVTMVAADAHARDAMQQALPQLREALAREGLALADASVHDQPRRDPGTPAAPPRAPRDGDFVVRGVDAATDVAGAVRARRLVDLYA